MGRHLARAAIGLALIAGAPETSWIFGSSSWSPGSSDPRTERGGLPFTQATVADELRRLLSAADRLDGQPSRAEVGMLHSLYGADYRPLWIDPSLLPSAAAAAALDSVGRAGEDGLNPAAYVFVEPARLAGRTPLSAEEAARVDLGLSLGFARYVRHIHMGRVDPRDVGFRLDAPPDDHDFAAIVRQAASDGRIVELVQQFRPPPPQYAALQQQLARYRALATAWRTLPPLPFDAVVRPGDPWPGVMALSQRLPDLGDWPAGAPAVGGDKYDGAVVAAVQQFQMRHGLEADGIIGKATRAALDVPLDTRVRQIELALERMRWLTHPQEERIVTVNIPMFRLWSRDARPGPVPPPAMNVIVGRALNTRTPVFTAVMQDVVFAPYWNVPVSILRGEILPAIVHNPRYLETHAMEIVDGPGDDARVLAATPETLARLHRGELRVRQRPGPANSLGTVKFVFPNAHDVYMHGTPAQSLFGRPRRDFSHGCVRLEKPVDMALWLLAEQGWTHERILEAMAQRRPQTVRLERPVRVLMFYVTAAVTPDDGLVHFAEDVYGHDARLERALKAARS